MCKFWTKCDKLKSELNECKNQCSHFQSQYYFVLNQLNITHININQKERELKQNILDELSISANNRDAININSDVNAWNKIFIGIESSSQCTADFSVYLRYDMLLYQKMNIEWLKRILYQVMNYSSVFKQNFMCCPIYNSIINWLHFII